MAAEVSRRVALAAGAGSVAAVALAACTSGSGNASSGSSGNAGAAGGSSTAGGSGTVLAKLADIPVGTAVAAKDASGAPVVVAQPTAGSAVAFSAICTHMGCQVAASGRKLVCPCHGSQYDALTGAVLQGPAPKPLPAVSVHVSGGNVVEGSA